MKKIACCFLLVFVALMVFAPAVVHASGGDEFSSLKEKVYGWLKGDLGLLILITACIVAIVAMIGGAIRAIAAPIFIAVFLGFGVAVLISITGATQGLPW